MPSPHLRRADRSALFTSRRATMLTFVGITLLAWGLRLHQLGAQSLWYDEGVTATLAQRSLLDLTQWTARDIQPPLYYYVVWGWGRLAGWSEWSLRFVSAWWGLLAIPLLAALAQRLARHRLTALITALLTALHPLLLYYSQEARMYTQLVTLGILAAYLLLRAGEPGASWQRWLRYGLVATAAVYTHYFAFFLLLALSVALLLDLLASRRAHQLDLLASRRAHQPDLLASKRAGQPSPALLRDPALLGCVITHLAILLLYLAWLGALFQQLTTDRSYWQGRLKIWEALRTVALRFTSGETVLEPTAVAHLPLYAFLTLLLFLVLSWQARRQEPMRRTLLYLLCWLVIPVIGVLGLAAFIPKFNARYVMLALPGLLLAWSAGIGVLLGHWGWGLADRAKDAGRADRHAGIVKRSSALFFVCTGAVLGLLLVNNFWLADRNWFSDPAFTKAQWRELAAYVREQREADEAVLLVSGHAWPIWEYYAPDLPALRLPDLAILDVNAVLDFANTGAALRPALQDKRGVWLVNWQEEVVDPNGVVLRQLLLAAREKPVPAEFWQLRLHHFVDLAPAAIQTTPPIATVLAANFGDQLRLQGYTVTPDGDLLLFWQLGSAPLQPLPDLYINLRTETPAGLLYTDPADQRPADYNFPVMRWQPGQMVMGRIPAAVWAGAGALPGHYQVQLGVYDPAGDPAGLDLLDPAGNRMGKFIRLPVQLPQATPSAANAANQGLGESLPSTPDAPPPGSTEPVVIAPGVKVAFAAAPVAAELGQPVAVGLHWLLEEPITAALDLRVQWRPAPAAAVVAGAALPMTGTLPMTAWPVGQWLRQVVALQAPVALPAGDYLLELVAKDVAARRFFTVLSSARNFVAPPLAMMAAIDFAPPGAGGTPQVRFLGLEQPLSTTVPATAELTLELVWQSLAPTTPAADYWVTLQLLGADGRPVAQVDQPLPGGSAHWLPGQVERQSLTLAAPPAAGRYPLLLALYQVDEGNFPRLMTPTGDDALPLGEITVAP